MLSRVRVSRCNVSAVALMLSVLGCLVFASGPASAAVTHTYLSQLTGVGDPTAVAVDAAGDVYVVDSSAGTVDRFSSTGVPLAFSASESYVEGAKLTGTPSGSFGEPRGVAVNDENGDLYVADRTAQVVDVFSSTGAYLSQLTGPPATAPVPGPFQYPWGLAVDQSTHDLYVTNTESHGFVDVFSSTGAYVSQFGAGVLDGFSRSVAVNDLTGDAYIEEASESGGASDVDVFGSTGSFLTPAWNGAGTPEGPFGFDTLHVGLDPTTHHVYVIDANFAVVDEFAASASEEYLGQLTGTPTGENGSFVPFSGAQAVAANPTNGDLYVADGEESGVVDVFGPAIEVPGTSVGAATGLTVSTAVVSGSVNPAGIQVTACEFEYGTSTSYGQSAPCEPAPAQIGAGNSPKAVTANLSALQPNTTYHYRLTAANANGSLASSDETFTTPLPPPTVTIAAVTQIGGSSATFNGVINPNGLESEYHFEYSTDGHHWNALAEGNAGSGSTGVSVSQTVSNLIGDTSYYVRLVGSLSGRESATSSAVTFTTAAEAPTISQTLAAPVSATSATLNAYIDPNNLATTYHFQYGTSTSYGSQAPEDESNIDSGNAPLPVTQSISGLQPDTTYHFRVVAVNSSNTSYGPDTTFTTQAPSGCPNEQVRSESAVNPETGVPFSLGLPECRAYEMVSPALKNGAAFTSEAFQAITAGSIVGRVGLEGSTVLVNSTGIWPGGTEQPANNDLIASVAKEGVRYKLARGESGWSFKPEVPSASDLRVYQPFLVPGEADMGSNGIWSGAGFAPDESNVLVNALFNPESNLYLLESGGAVVEIGPSVPLSDRGAPVEGNGSVIKPGGASADLSRVLFSVGNFRWPFDETELPSTSHAIPSLYEYAGAGHTGVGSDVPSLVGVDNTGALISQCGTEAGTTGEATWEAQAISSGGSTVFFTALAAGAECDANSRTGEGTGPAVNQLFARVGALGVGAGVGNSVTVNVAGTSECATGTFDSCNVTKAVSYQGASTDGSKVFFTSEQPLVVGETDSTNNLYECKLPGDSGAPLTRRTPVDPCPDLIQVSAGSSTAGTPGAENANVQSVAAVSADGSHVYFTAKGVLTGENAEHNSPTLGKDNLYVWQEPSASYPQGHTAFIATLPSAAFSDVDGEGGQATPDGDSFVFTSAADLTPDDTSTVNQVFLYEAQHEVLIRVSKGQDGFNDDGNTTINPASIATGDERRTISEDGSVVVFESSDALTAQVHPGTQHNVYLWRDGEVSLISDGTPAGESILPANPNTHSAGLVGIDASGDNVFFVTEAHLVGQDSDELPDLYDARIDGGFPAPRVNECVGEACQGTLPAALAPVTPASLSQNGAGNLTPAVKATLPPRPLTRAQKLAKALEACKKDKLKQKRAQCEAQARKRYGTKTKAKGKRRAKRKTRKSSGKGDK